MQRSLNNNKIQHLHGPIQKLACIKKKKNLKGKQPTELYCKSIYKNEI